jgi:methionine sulfoxide reductase heme-binding subunit
MEGTAMDATLRRAVTGWRLTGTLSIVIMLMAFALLASHDFDVDGIRLVIRATAQNSLVLFSLAFSAAVLARMWPNAWTRWQRHNRRYLGVSFAVSHAVHAVAIVGFALIDPLHFHQVTSIASFVFGGIAYGFIIAMTITSFDATAAWIGPRNWLLLHNVGAHDIWLTFLISEGMRAVHDGSYYWLPTAILIAVMSVRLIGHRARRPMLAPVTGS